MSVGEGSDVVYTNIKSELMTVLMMEDGPEKVRDLKHYSPTEQKHCALVKLNFDSKEMASLLNISLKSVHMSRHRIRKKIGLDREDSLSNYIARF